MKIRLWLSEQWHDIKGNVKFYLLLLSGPAVLGGLRAVRQRLSWWELIAVACAISSGWVVAIAVLVRTIPRVTNISLFRDLRQSTNYGPRVGLPPVSDRYHLARITFSKSGKWSSGNVAVYLLTGGTNYPFDFIAPKKFRIRDDQIGPTEIVAEIFRVNSNWLATEPGSWTGPAELTLVEAVPDQYRLFSLSEGTNVILKIGVSVNNKFVKTQSILVRPIKKQEDPATGHDLWDVIFEKAN